MCNLVNILLHVLKWLQLFVQNGQLVFQILCGIWQSLQDHLSNLSWTQVGFVLIQQHLARVVQGMTGLLSIFQL